MSRKGAVDNKSIQTFEKPEINESIKKFKDIANGELTLLKQRDVGHDISVSTIISSISSSSKNFRPTKTDLGLVRDKTGFDRDLCTHVLLLRQELLLLKKKGVGMSDAIEQLTQRILTSKKEPELKPGGPGHKEKGEDTRKGKRRRDTDGGEPRPSKKVTRKKDEVPKKGSPEDVVKNFSEIISGDIPGSGESLVTEFLGALGLPPTTKQGKIEERTESDVQQLNKKRKRMGDISESDVESEPVLKQPRFEDGIQEIHKPCEILGDQITPPSTPGYPASWTPGSTDSPIYGPVDSLVDSPVYSPSSPSYAYNTVEVPVYDGPVDGLVDGTVDSPVARPVDSLAVTPVTGPIIGGDLTVVSEIERNGPVTGLVDVPVTGPVAVPVDGPGTVVDVPVTAPVMGPVTAPVPDPVDVTVTGPVPTSLVDGPIEGFMGDFILGSLPLPEMDEIVPFSLGEAGKRRLETADDLLVDVERSKRRNINL